MMKGNLEKEVKFLVKDFKKIFSILENKGTLIASWVFEKNLVLDDCEHTLRNKDILLRLRQDKKNKLTLKLPPSHEGKEIKERWELEVEVSDFFTMQSILNYLGFKKSFAYEKFREIWQVKEVLVCLDILPFGKFVELEGEHLKEVALELGFEWKSALKENYLELAKNLKGKLTFTSEEISFFKQELFKKK